MKERLRKLLTALRRKVLSWLALDASRDADVLAPIMSQMASSGAGTDACLRAGCLPLPVHFHSPVPDLTDLEQRHIWDARSPLNGIDFQPEAQLALLKDLGQAYASECAWPLHATADPHQFFTENSSFSYGCAASLHSVVRRFKPRRIVEVGSGNSSLVISAALRRNMADGVSTEYTIIGPYPRDVIEHGLPQLTGLVKQRVELTARDPFLALAENDVLFVDSSHVVRTGSDVNSVILEVLPLLAPGVIIHFHDIHLPREYAKVYFTNPSFRVFWTEAYLLQAFLACNPFFEVLLALDYLMRDQPAAFQEAFPHYQPEQHRAVSGSFWIRRKPVGA